ncbi:MAG: class II fructose-bisphosphatase [Actinomycetia bacterium]|nr:class II fructose-bisphosphatase [Actinomycetes bacterium]
MERVLALEFARVTEAAAIAAARHMGRGDKEAIDAAAVEAMRAMLQTVRVSGTVVIGEGEMDEAPMLYIGEEVGAGGERVDVAVDPVEGTNLVAKGLSGAIATIAVAPAGHLLHAPDMYMDKIACGPACRGLIDLDRPIGETLRLMARRLERRVEDLTVVILDRDRHRERIAAVRAAGARLRLITDGDVIPAVAACLPESGVDLMLGIGGAPEGVLAAAAVRCLGGDFQGRLWPTDEAERERAQAMGVDPDARLGMEDLVRGDDVIFAATGITDGDVVPGVRFMGNEAAQTTTLVTRSRTGTVRWVTARHHLARKRQAVGSAGWRLPED